MKRNTLILGSLGIGAGLMYLLDPDRGRRRRASVRDAVNHIINSADRTVGKVSRDLSNRATGVVAELNSIFKCDEVDDRVLAERVRAHLGRAVSHPHAIHVAANQGCLTLSGDILASEVEQLLNCVCLVRGVKSVENLLKVYDRAEHISSLQGGVPRTGAAVELRRRYWSPATRFLMGLGGGVLATYGARRKDALSTAIGMGLITRGLTNMEVKDLLGLGDSHGIDVRKTITINAPVRKVYETWRRHENFPHFMSRVREVKALGNWRYHWTVAGPAGTTVEWEAVITKLVPKRLIAWQSVPDSSIEQQGTVRFRPNGSNKTIVDVRLSYYPPAGAIGHTIASLFGVDPKSELDADLMRMKSYIESGRQPHDAAERQTSKAQAL